MSVYDCDCYNDLIGHINEYRNRYSEERNTDEKITIKDLGNILINMESNDMIIDGFIINIGGKEIFSKELSLKLSAPHDDCHVEYRCKFYVE